jgi:hypothetical protein
MFQDSGLEVVDVLGISGSPSCGVQTTLDLPGALVIRRRCHWPSCTVEWSTSK